MSGGSLTPYPAFVVSGNSRDLGRGRIIPVFPWERVAFFFLSRNGWVSQVNNSRPPFHTFTTFERTDLVSQPRSLQIKALC